MSKIKWLVACSAVLVAMLVSCTRVGQTVVPDIPVDSVRNGDIVFRRGRSFSSEVILSHDDGMYSHIGIVYKNDSMQCVIHAVNEEPEFKGDFDRVKIEPIESFFSSERASAGAMYHSWVSDSLSAIITANALQLVRDSVRFDSGFNHYNSNELYCTELVYVLYKNCGIDITEGRRTAVGVICFPDEVIFPADIQRNKKMNKYFEF